MVAWDVTAKHCNRMWSIGRTRSRVPGVRRKAEEVAS